ncbi:MmcQ/YjbR family DNA-binding protein [Yinghuangia aomiensis]|uniref:MmcQ/YjbR family DNA-binding protein n=2 Tax=Kitasatosporales TaxID=85011 RepID=A0ABP9HQD3_9ACTN
MIMTPEELRSVCLDFNGSREEFPFNPDVSVFKVGKKVFALSSLGAVPLTISLKCDPQIALRLRAEYPAIVGGYHLNKRHWNTVTLDGTVPEQLVRDMIEDSYDLIVAQLPRMERLKLDWPGDSAEAGREDGQTEG